MGIRFAADLDNDGDLDVIVNCLNDAPLLYRNETSAPRVEVRLRGRAPNTRGIGSKIRVFAPGLPPQSAEVIAGGRYLSSDEGARTFAAGSPTNRLTIEVAWSRGRKAQRAAEAKGREASVLGRECGAARCEEQH